MRFFLVAVGLLLYGCSKTPEPTARTETPPSSQIDASTSTPVETTAPTENSASEEEAVVEVSTETVDPRTFIASPPPAAAPAATPVPKDPNARLPVTLIREYNGSYSTEFTLQFDRVRLLFQQAQLEISSRLGLFQYREGFKYPISIRFEDTAPREAENALAYVRLMEANTGEFSQELVINLKALSAHPMNFDTVFYHEMAHAIMNDAAGGQAAQDLPRWLHEGLAMYISGEGDERVRIAARPLYRSQAGRLVTPLDGPLNYPQYYLAVKYIYEKHSINALQALVRNLINERPLPEAFQDALGISLPEFEQNVRDYSLRIFKDHARPDYQVDPSVKPKYIKDKLDSF